MRPCIVWRARARSLFVEQRVGSNCFSAGRDRIRTYVLKTLWLVAMWRIEKKGRVLMRRPVRRQRL